MNVLYRGRLFRDDEGDELPVEQLRDHALRAARDLIALTRTNVIRSWWECTFEITDEVGRSVMTVPFGDTDSSPE